MNKKYFFIGGIIVFLALVIGVVFAFKKLTAPVTNDQGQVNDEAIPDLPQSQWPIVALIPSSDGHYLSLKIKSLNVPTAVSMDYELLYKTNNTGTYITQGVPGTIQISGQTGVNRDSILLGSESSGKVRFDKGVENGTLTLRFRDGNGKLLGKVLTDFHLQNNVTTLSSVDGSFKYSLDKVDNTVWFVTMKPFGTPSSSDVVVYQKAYAIYASDMKPHTGKVN